MEQGARGVPYAFGVWSRTPLVFGLNRSATTAESAYEVCGTDVRVCSGIRNRIYSSSRVFHVLVSLDVGTGSKENIPFAFPLQLYMYFVPLDYLIKAPVVP